MSAPHLILADLVRAKAAAHPDLDVLTFVDAPADAALVSEVRTYQGLWDNARRMAAVLTAKGLAPGQAFALLMQNRPEFVEAMIAASITGTVFVPLDPRLGGERLSSLLRRAGCRGVIVADEAARALEAALSTTGPEGLWVLRVGENAGPDGLWAQAPTTPPPLDVASTDPDAPMQLLFTSGTTGEPKAIVSPHRRFGEAGALLPVFGLKADDRPYTGLSLTHANAQLLTVGAALHLGLRAVISRRFSRSRLWEIIRAFDCTIFNLLGGMTVEVFGADPRPDDADNPVRMVVSAGMPTALWRRFEARFGLKVLEFYGAAEGGLTLNRPGEGPVGSVGRPPPGMVVAILDEDGAPLPEGALGEIAFRLADGSAPKVGYLNDAAATAAKLRGGWLRMGDIGRMDAEGWLYFHHRAGGAIRRNGEFIDPGEVEAALAAHPAVADVCVYGVAAASGAPGERDIVAAVAQAAGAVFDPQSLLDFAAQRLPARLSPSFVQVVEAIPKTASEKPLERVLAEAFRPDADNVWRAAR